MQADKKYKSSDIKSLKLKKSIETAEKNNENYVIFQKIRYLKSHLLLV